ncbi:MAG: adenylate/guanylate cyclase domain-containing protein [Alphaproteobacteria bacterium]|nr:adenylate/guanylate cyclase domain-containing protein [Alphaproteobacteria bacterium]
MQRRLAAIVHADLAGFTRMMEGAETRTFRHLKAAQIEVWRPAIVAGGGRLVGTAGDAMLAEFGSAVGAVAASIDIQERMAQFNDRLDESQRMLFRIGVHLGEVIVDEEDQNIFGDGVNLAARIQAMAKPGHIAVSRAVRDVTELRIDYTFVDGGEHRMKNVSRPVHIYHVLTAAAVAAEAQAAPAVHATVDAARTTTRLLPKITLRFEGVDSAGQKYAFDVALDRLMRAPQGLTIGRAADQCDFVVAHGTVSRRHARLTLAGEALQIEDLGSTNGTSVGEVLAAVGSPLAVKAGVQVRLGDVRLGVKQT